MAIPEPILIPTEKGLQLADDSLEALIRKYFEPLVYFTVQGGVDIMAGEDVVIQIITKIWNVRDSLHFRSPDGLRAYLFQATRNRMLDHIASVKREKARRHAWAIQSSEYEEGISDPRLRTALGMTTAMEMVMKAIEGLPERQKQVAKLRMAGLTTEEISRRLDISPKTVRSHLSAGIESLKEQFKDHQPVVHAMIVLSYFETLKFVNHFPHL